MAPEERTDVDQAGHQWIAGRRRAGRGAPDDVLDPATGKVVASAQLATVEDVDDAVAAARSAQQEWGALPPAERSAAMHRLAAELDADADELARTETSQTG
jgi:betaine-aldehyde dehydrogenase